MTLLSVRDLTMRFGGLTAVDALSFDVQERAITSVIGPNGAGKTTVFNCITGFYRPTSGRLIVTPPAPDESFFEPSSGKLRLSLQQRDPIFLERMAGHRIARRARVARTFQNIRLFAGMTVLENLLVAQHNALMPHPVLGLLGVIGVRPARAAEARAVERARIWLARIGLEARADDPAGALPYGSQRRLEIARAMCTDPVLLCLDEPAAGLNPAESAALNALLLSIRDEGVSVLLIEHDMGVVMRISDHVVVLDHGRKIADGTPAAVQADPRVIAAYLGEGDEDEAA